MAKSNSEFKSIQKKLVAAVAMVLVASIMVVSSSYAWFTLSTAPEVTGIQTSVGSNGNLEMALNIDKKNVDDITSDVGKTFPTANNYWGNLVDLSDSSYKLSEMALAPARLNFTAGTPGKVNAGYLFTPIYGSDGRVSGFDRSVESGMWIGTGFFANDKYGVRALGVASGLSAGAKALRDAKSAVRTAQNNVIRAARASLEVDAINLASIIVAKQLDSTKSTVTAAEWSQVTTAVANLKAIASELKNTMDKVVIAVAVAGGKMDLTADGITYTNDGATASGVTIPGELNVVLGEAYKSLTSINGMVTDAEVVIKGTTANADTTYPYDKVNEVMTSVLSVGDIRIDGQDLTGKKKDQIIPIVMNAYLDNEGKLPMNIVSGIYADIQAFIGVYSASAKMSVSLVGTTYENTFGPSISVTAQMKVENPAPTTGFYMDAFVLELDKLVASDAGNGNTSTPLDVYAYAIDLAFRTNAANSNLMLQTAPASRVGADTTASVQGGGSYMEFTIGNDEHYTANQMKDLMSAIRIVLMDTQTQDIYAIGALDMGVAEESTVNGKAVVKAYIYLYNYSDSAGKLVLGEKIVTEDTDGTKTAITRLTQNQAMAMTAMVYLDGDYVDNSDVATFGNSMTGTINLQFASSADLVPMDYTFEEGETPVTPTLAEPVASISADDKLTWTVEEGVTYAVAYGTSVENAVALNIANGGDVSDAIAAANADAVSGPYKIVVTATKDAQHAVKVLDYTYTK